MSCRIVSIASWYVNRGWWIVPLPGGQKGPRVPGWQDLRLTPEELERHLRDPEMGIGILLGQPSGLVDIDLDVPVAVDLADEILPPSDMVHGRAGNPSSHRWYRTLPLPARTHQYKDPEDGAVLVELRSTGAQTMVPPSTHPDGDVLRWEDARGRPIDEPGEPAEIELHVLQQAVDTLAAATLIARRWPREPGECGEYAAAVVALMVQGEVRPATAVDRVVQVARVVGDDETADALREGGAPDCDRDPELVLGRRVAERLRDWLGLSPPELPAPSPAPLQPYEPPPPTAAVADHDHLEPLRALVGQLPPGAGTWTWLGWIAARAGVADQARGLAVTAEDASAYEAGASAPPGARFAAPIRNGALIKEITRALERLALPQRAAEVGSSIGLAVRRLVHYRRARSLGGTYDVELATPAKAVVVRGLSGSDLRSYGRVADAALACGLLLPVLAAKKANGLWANVLGPALAAAETVDLSEAAEGEVMIEDAIRDLLTEAPRGQDLGDLDRGSVLERAGEALVTPWTLVRHVRRALPDDPPDRAAVLLVAAAVGGRVMRHYYFADLNRRKAVVAFPLAPAEESSASPGAARQGGAEP